MELWEEYSNYHSKVQTRDSKPCKIHDDDNFSYGGCSVSLKFHCSSVPPNEHRPSRTCESSLRTVHVSVYSGGKWAAKPASLSVILRCGVLSLAYYIPYYSIMVPIIRAISHTTVSLLSSFIIHVFSFHILPCDSTTLTGSKRLSSTGPKTPGKSWHFMWMLASCSVAASWSANFMIEGFSPEEKHLSIDDLHGCHLSNRDTI